MRSGVLCLPRRRLRRPRRAQILGRPPELRLPQPQLVVRSLRGHPLHLGPRRRSLPEALESGIRWRRRECELLLTPEVPQLLSQRRAS